MASLLDGLRLSTDSRARHGRMGPRWGMLARLTLAAMHGETSVRGMWWWGTVRAEQVVRRLGRWRSPSLSTL